MAQTGPGKAHRHGISMMKLADLFPNEAATQAWFEAQRWGDKPMCPHCERNSSG